RVNPRGLPGDCHRGKTAPPIGPSWRHSGPLHREDALDTGRAGTRRHLRPPPMAVSHHHGVLTLPPPPPVIPWHVGASQRLPDLPRVAQATGPVVPCDDPRMHLLRACYEITISFLLAWEDGVIPLAVEDVSLEMELLHGLSRDFDPCWIRVLIQLADHRQARRGRRGRNQVDNHLVAHERLPAPVLADEGEQPMLDLVPLARARREVGHC